MKRYNDLVAGLLVVVISFAMYLFSDSIKRMVVTTIGPDFMPKLIAVIMGILGLILTVQGIIVLKSKPGNTVPDTGSSVEKSRNGFVALFKNNLDIVTLLLLVLYAVGISLLGFIISTTTYIFLQIILMTINKRKNYIVFVTISIAFSCVIYFVFTKFLYVMLPAGLLG